MSLVIDGTGSITGLTATGISAVQQLPSGSVLQVVQGTVETSSSTSSTTYQASSLTATITPKFATSKIFVLFTTTCVQTTTGQSAQLTVFRNGATNLGGGINLSLSAYENSSSGGYQWVPATGSILDTPATTSATTYTIYFKTPTSGTVVVNWASSKSTITLMEIAV